MEDWDMLAADCVVLCCCCQCLTLQIIIFVFVKVPSKLVRKTKDFAKKKLGHVRRDKKTMQSETSRTTAEFLRAYSGSFRIEFGGFSMNEFEGFEDCMEEVEKVLEEMSQRGEFQFGSFWGGEESGSCSACLRKQELDYNAVHYDLIEMFGSYNSL